MKKEQSIVSDNEDNIDLILLNKELMKAEADEISISPNTREISLKEALSSN